MGNRGESQITWQIANWQGIILTIILCLGGLLPFNAAGQSLGRNMWVAYCISLVPGVFYLLLLKGLLRVYPGCTLYQINQKALGRKVGMVFTFIFLFQFLNAFAYYLLELVHFWISLEVHGQSIFIWSFLILLLTMYASRLGMEVISRVVFFVVVFLAIMVTMDTLLVLSEMSLQRFLPLWQFTWKPVVRSSLHYFFLPFSILSIVITFTPHFKRRSTSLRTICLGVLAAVTYFCINIARNVALLGDAIFLQYNPTMQALRMVEWNTAIIRLEIFGILTMMSISLSFLMITYAAVTNTLHEVFHTSKRPLIYTGVTISIIILMYGYYKMSNGLGINVVSIIGESLTGFLIVMQVVYYLIGRKRRRAAARTAPQE